MPKGLVITGIDNRIEYATHDGKGLITGICEDVTTDAIKAVMQHMDNALERSNKDWDYFSYEIEGFGELRFYPVERGDQA